MFLGYFPEISRKIPGNVQEIAWKFPGNFPAACLVSVAAASPDSMHILYELLWKIVVDDEPSMDHWKVTEPMVCIGVNRPKFYYIV